MLHYTISAVWGRLGRFAMSLVAVVLGTAFLAGTMIFSNQAAHQMTQLSLGRLPDIVVAAEDSLDAERIDVTAASYTQADVDAVTKIDGVVAAHAPAIVDGVAFETKDGDLAGGMRGTQAIGWSTFTMTTGDEAMMILEGRKPGRDEFVLDESTFNEAGYAIGDTVEISIPRVDDYPVTKKMTLVGVGNWTGSPATVATVFLDDAQLSRIGGLAAHPQLWVDLADDADEATAINQINDAVNDGTAITAATAAEDISNVYSEAMTTIQPVMTVFAVIALIVATFLIVNTMSILVVQRSREIGMLRAIGASAGQIRRSVIGEGLILGVIGSALGVLAGWGLGALLIRRVVGSQAGVVAPDSATVGATMTVGVVITLVASIVPSIRAARVSPVQAMSSGNGKTQGPVTQESVSNPPATKNIVMTLARLNLRRQPGRTVATSLSLAIGLFVISVAGVFLVSVKSSINELVPDMMKADLTLMSMNSSIPGVMLDDVADLDDVAEVVSYQATGAAIGDEPVQVGALDSADDFGRIITMELVTGEIPDDLGEMMVHRGVADQEGYEIGDSLSVVINGNESTYQVVGIFTYPENTSMFQYFTSSEQFQSLGITNNYAISGVFLAEGADHDAVKDEVRDIIGSTGTDVMDNAAFKADVEKQITGYFGVVYALVAFSVIIAGLGIANTMSLAVAERTREIALLRATGASGWQVGAMVVTEATFISLLGGLAGILAGLGLGCFIINSVDGITLAIDPKQLVLMIAISILVGVVASVIPSWRASRMNVLDAIAT